MVQAGRTPVEHGQAKPGRLLEETDFGQGGTRQLDFFPLHYLFILNTRDLIFRELILLLSDPTSCLIKSPPINPPLRFLFPFPLPPSSLWNWRPPPPGLCLGITDTAERISAFCSFHLRSAEVLKVIGKGRMLSSASEESFLDSPMSFLGQTQYQHLSSLPTEDQLVPSPTA